MSLSFFRYGTRRCFSVFKTAVPSAPNANVNAVASATRSSDEKYVKVYQKAEDVDQKRVVVPSNRDLFPADTPTHTGQVYDRDDYRNVRFVNKGKLVRVHSLH
jgi:hypothetical protein